MFEEKQIPKDTTIIKMYSRVILSLQQRTGSKTLTNIQGLDNELNLDKILKNLKKTFSTGGTLIKTDEDKQILQLQGDKRNDVYKFLVANKICDKSNIVVKGM
jgi:translation initiation factor SUI1